MRPILLFFSCNGSLSLLIPFTKSRARLLTRTPTSTRWQCGCMDFKLLVKSSLLLQSDWFYKLQYRYEKPVGYSTGVAIVFAYIAYYIFWWFIPLFVSTTFFYFQMYVLMPSLFWLSPSEPSFWGTQCWLLLPKKIAEDEQMFTRSHRRLLFLVVNRINPLHSLHLCTTVHICFAQSPRF
jgi:hypothetical protein